MSLYPIYTCPIFVIAPLRKHYIMTDVSLITALSVLPPPPRYPTQAAYNAAVGAGHIPPMIETNNILSNPEDHFLVGEGELAQAPSCFSLPAEASSAALRDPG